MEQIAQWMKQAIDNRDNPKELAKLKKEVIKVAGLHPVRINQRTILHDNKYTRHLGGYIN